MSSLLFPVFKLGRENTQPENICDIIFEKTKSVYAEATVERVLWKRCYEKFRRIHKKHVPESLLLMKSNSVDLQLL